MPVKFAYASIESEMKFELLPLSEAKGKILGHNIAGLNGKRMLRKGKPLTDDDLGNLHQLGRTSVYVVQMEESDVDENTAARASASPLRHLTLNRDAMYLDEVRLCSSSVTVGIEAMWN